MKNVTGLLGNFENLTNEQISKMFQDLLNSMFDVISTDIKHTDTAEDNNKKTETTRDCCNCEVESCYTCNKQCCHDGFACDAGAKHDTNSSDCKQSETTDVEYKSPNVEEKNEYFTRIGNILTDWLKPWLKYSDKDVDDTAVKTGDSKFDYEINEVLKYDVYKSAHSIDELNEKVFDIFDMCVFKMLVVGQAKTCKLTITWVLENDSICTFTFFWDPETCAFYGYVNDFKSTDAYCLKYNEQNRGFDKTRRTALSDYMKTNITQIEDCSVESAPIELSTEQNHTDNSVSRRDTAANIYKRFNNLEPVDCESGDIWDKIITATDKLLDNEDFAQDCLHGETRSITFFPRDILFWDSSLPNNIVDRINYGDYTNMLELRYGFPRAVLLDRDIVSGKNERFIRCYLK